jgi:iron complex transport system substrate-binding protein
MAPFRAHVLANLPHHFGRFFLLRKTVLGVTRCGPLAVGFLVLFLSLTGCRGEVRPAAGADAAPVVDHFGDTIPVVAARRVISMMPASTEILFAIGAGPLLVGRSEFDKWPDAALAVPDLGPGLRPNVEALLAARPDLVILYASQDNHAAARRLREAGITTAAFKVDSIEQFDRLTRLLGRLTGDSVRGDMVADTVMRTLDSVRALTSGLPRVRVVMPAYEQPFLVIGGGSFLSQLVEIAGGRNVYDSIPHPSPAVTFEDLIRRDPDVVLAPPDYAETLRRSPRWRALPAVRAGRVLPLDTALVYRPAVRIGEGAVSLARLLHPSLAAAPPPAPASPRP